MPGMKQVLYSVGGPFPFDRSFRGQSVVEGDWINAARKEGFGSKILSMHHCRSGPAEVQTEPHQKRIARDGFGSELLPRYKQDFREALRSRSWGGFLGLDDAQRSLAEGNEVHYIMHYYNSRFQDGQTAALAAGSSFEGLPFSGYYVLHVNPDQLHTRGDYEEWKRSDDARQTASRLGDIVKSGFFRRIIAVSESTKEMWLDLLRSMRLYDEAELAEKKTKVVPNGVDTDLYSHISDSLKSRLVPELGFSPDVNKIVLLMTRPSLSKGSDRLLDAMRAFERSEDPSMEKVGFLVALPDSDGCREFLDEIRSFEKLLIRDRLKITIDVSKVVRVRGELINSMNEILSVYQPVASMSRGFVEPRAFPLTYVSDVMLHVPRAEAYGLVVAEALSSGCGVVTTRAGGIPGVVASWKEQAEMVGGDDTRETVQAILKAERAHSPNPSAAKALSVFDRLLKVIG
jgi:glycosyltransferase involved in cell wall biosynthesis